jgi:pyruvate dehydrogenase (quinone)
MPGLFEQAVQSALQHRGVAVLTLPGDVGGLDVPKGTPAPHITAIPRPVAPDGAALDEAARLLDGAETVTMLVGAGARDARAEVLALADRLAAPIVLTLKAKERLEDANVFEVGQSGLIGNPAARRALDGGDVLLMVGTDFPYREWYPEGKTVIQIDARGEHIGRRTAVALGIVGDAQIAAAGLAERVAAKSDRGHLDGARKDYVAWRERQARLTAPDADRGLLDKAREVFENPDRLIRPEALAAAVDRRAADDAVFTSDTGMSTVWLSRFVTLRGTRRLVGSYNLGSMANAMPQALGAQALDRSREVVAFCGDGGLTMLLGDLLTAVAHRLPVRIVVFDNGRLGMVKLEQEQGGLPEFGTVLHNPDLAAVARAMGLHAVRVEDPEGLDAAVEEAFAAEGPVLLDVVTNPDELSLPPKLEAGEAWGFAVAKIKETLESRGA